MEDKYHFLTLYHAYEEKKILFYYLGKEYRIPTTRMSIKDIFLFLKNPTSVNAHPKKACVRLLRHQRRTGS